MKRCLFITIDTEEDNWGDNVIDPSVENIDRIPRLQEIFDRHGAIPTYLVNYPVAAGERSAAVFREIHRSGRCEIGAHCHAWNTPPFEEERTPRNTFMHNLPPELVRRKMATLQAVIERNIGATPVSFRAGRWGFSGPVATILRELNYRVDSSITPFCDWEDTEGGPVFGLRDNGLFWFNEATYPPRQRYTNPGNAAGDFLLEVPPTMGFLQPYFRAAYAVRHFLAKPVFRPFRANGLLEKLHLVNYRWLSPENSFVEDMIALSRTVLKKGYPFLNLFFHSNSLIPGRSPFIKTEADVDEMLRKIDVYLAFIESQDIPCVGLSRAQEVHQ